MVWGGVDVLRSVADVVKWPFERAVWAIERGGLAARGAHRRWAGRLRAARRRAPWSCSPPAPVCSGCLGLRQRRRLGTAAQERRRRRSAPLAVAQARAGEAAEPHRCCREQPPTSRRARRRSPPRSTQRRRASNRPPQARPLRSAAAAPAATAAAAATSASTGAAAARRRSPPAGPAGDQGRPPVRRRLRPLRDRPQRRQGPHRLRRHRDARSSPTRCCGGRRACRPT